MDDLEKAVEAIEDSKVRRAACDLVTACDASDAQAFLVIFQRGEFSPVIVAAGLPQAVAAAWAESFRPVEAHQ